MPGPAKPDPPRRRIVLPSPRLLRATAALAALTALAPVLPWLYPLLGTATLVLVCLALLELSARPAAGAIVVERQAAPLDHVGRRGRIAVELRNTSPSALAVELRQVLPAALEGEPLCARALLAPGSTWRRELAFVAAERGLHALPALGLRVGHPLGLLELQHSHADAARVRVAPGRPAGETQGLLVRATALAQLGERQVRRRGAGLELDGLREWVVGDELRHVDWKASARRHRPISREHRAERHTELLLLLDCGRLMGTLVGGVRKLDLAMTPLLDLAAVALRRGERVGLLAFDARPRAFVPPRAGLAHLSSLTEALAALPHGVAPTAYLPAVAHLESKQRRRAMLVLLTDFTDERSARDAYAALAALARRHLLLLVAVGDPHLAAMLDSDAAGGRAALQKAAAGHLLHERRLVLAMVERLGVAALDAEPERLSGPLLSRYLGLRWAGAQ